MPWFGRKKDEQDSLDPQYLLKKAQADDAATAGAASTFGVFRMTVGDVFSISGRGTVVTGTVEAGAVTKGATVRLSRKDSSTRDVVVDGVEMFRKIVDTAKAGDTVGLLVKSLRRDDIAAGDVLSG